MLGKNNRFEQEKKMTDKHSYFSLRKTKLGLMSCLIGLACIYQSSEVVLAEELVSASSVDKQEERLPVNSELAEEPGLSSEQDSLTSSDESLNQKKTEKANESGHEEKTKKVGTEQTTPNSEAASVGEKGEDQKPLEEKEAIPSKNVADSVVEKNQEDERNDKGHFKVRAADIDLSSEDNGLGAINNYRQNDNVIELDYETGEKGQLVFNQDNIFRYYIDPNGNFSNPLPSRADKPAQIVKSDFIKQSVVPIVSEVGNILRIATNQIVVDLDKNTSLMKIKNAQSGNIVLEEAKPLVISDTDTTQYLKSNEKSHYFGGGTQNGRFAHKGNKINIENENVWTDGGVASPSPFYFSTDGYGVLRNTFVKGQYDFEYSQADEVATKHEEERFDAYYIIADKAQDIIKGYYEITGKPIVLPEFAYYEGHLNAYNRDYWLEATENTPGAIYFDEIGKWFVEVQPSALGNREGIKETLNGEPSDKNYPFTARAELLRYKKHDMPLGWMLVNDGYGAGYGQEDTLDGNIKNLREFSEWADKNFNVKTGLWTQSELTPDESQPALLQRDLAKEVSEGLVRVLKTDVAWVGPGYSFGLNGVQNSAKIMVEESGGMRPFIISLDGWGGTQHYASIWTGDQTGGQWEYIRFHIPTYIGTGLSGQPNITSDVDGIFGGNNPVINTRDYQWKTFTTMLLNMDGWGSNPKNPFAFDATTTDINRSYNKLKSILLPYTYSIHHHAEDGKPVVRAMFIDFPNEEINYTDRMNYQYMYGDSFLVAPIYENTSADQEGNDIRNEIYLPKGSRWIDYFTGDVYDGGQMLNNFEAPIWKTPVFVRSGAIIPVNAPNNNPKDIDRTLRKISFYPDGESQFTLVEDDGVSMDYTNGGRATTRIQSNAAEDGHVVLTVNPSQGNFDGQTAQKRTQFNVNTTKKPQAVELFINGEKVSLTEVNSLDEFNNGKNVYYYDKAPNLNQFSTEEGKYYGKELIKNPVLRVITDSYDVTQTEVRVELDGFEYDQNKFTPIVGESGEAPNVQVAADGLGAYSVPLNWTAVDQADRYEVLADGIVYTNILDNHFVHNGLDPETEHSYKVRAIIGDQVTPWSTEIVQQTAEDPYRNAVKDIVVSSNTPAQSGQDLSNLVDGDLASTYHSDWGKKAVPEALTFDLGRAYKLDKMEYYPRTDAGNGTILQGDIQYSIDGVNWKPTDNAFQWSADNEMKTIDLSTLEARYVRVNVNQAVGDFVSGNEMLFYHQDGDEGYVVGDITNDGLINENDLTSFRNYAGLKRGDSDFEGYVERADSNKNDAIDAYDIYLVTHQMNQSKLYPIRQAYGSLEWVTSQEEAKAGDEVKVVLRGNGLKNVQAINATYTIDGDRYEVVNDQVNTNNALADMNNFSRVRSHSDNTRTVNAILVNDGGSQPIDAEKIDIISFTLRVKKDGPVDLSLEDPMLIGSNLLANDGTITDVEDSVIREIEVVADKPDQPGSEISNLVDGDFNSQYHSKWQTQAVPETIVFDFKKAYHLDRLEYYPRTDAGNGTILEGTIEYSSDGENWTEIPSSIKWSYDNQVKQFDLSDVTAQYIRMTVQKAVGDFVSGREMTFYHTGEAEATESPLAKLEEGLALLENYENILTEKIESAQKDPNIDTVPLVSQLSQYNQALKALKQMIQAVPDNSQGKTELLDRVNALSELSLAQEEENQRPKPGQGDQDPSTGEEDSKPDSGDGQGDQDPIKGEEDGKPDSEPDQGDQNPIKGEEDGKLDSEPDQGDQNPSKGEEEGHQDSEPDQGDQDPIKGEEDDKLDPEPGQVEGDQGSSGGQVDKPEAEEDTTITAEDPALVTPDIEETSQVDEQQANSDQKEDEQIVAAEQIRLDKRPVSDTPFVYKDKDLLQKLVKEEDGRRLPQTSATTSFLSIGLGLVFTAIGGSLLSKTKANKKMKD